jgi:hypothetical protein
MSAFGLAAAAIARLTNSLLVVMHIPFDILAIAEEVLNESTSSIPRVC